MAAITVPNPLVDTKLLIALDEAAIERRDALVDHAAALLQVPIVDAASLSTADAAYADLRAFEKEVEAQRKKLKAPILDIGRKLDAAAEEACIAAANVRTELGNRIADFQRAEDARAEAERRRLEEEARARQAELDAQAERDRAAAQAQADADRLPDEPPAEVPVTAHIAPRVEVAAPAPVLKSKAVRMATVYDLVIDDVVQIPREFLNPDEARIKAALKAGAKVAGCRLVERNSFASKAGAR